MINPKLVLFFLLLLTTGYTQEITISSPPQKVLITEILERFQASHQFNFSFDVDLIRDINVVIDKENISIVDLQRIIAQQTQYNLQKIEMASYIIVENNDLLSVCGIVLDELTSFELAQADISKNKTTQKITNRSGVFQIQLKPWDTITISYLGYYSKSILAKNFTDTCDTIRLTPKIENLNQVIVREYLTKGIQKNEDASVRVSTKKLRILPGLIEPDVLQSLQLLPGVSSPTEDPAGLYIRGGTPDQNLVLWDGIKMYHTGHFFDQISTFNPYIVESVNVYRGGTSVRYGDRLSGVIEIESDNDLTTTLKAGGGINLTHGDAFVKVPLSEKAGIMLAGRRSTTDIYQNITYNNLVQKVFQNTRANIPEGNKNLNDAMEKDDFSFSDSNFKFVWTPNDNNILKISSLFVENRLDILRDIQSVSKGKIKINDNLKLRNIGSSINWTSNFANGITQEASFYLSIFDQRYNIGADFTELNELLTQSEQVKLSDIGGEYTLNIPIKKRHRLGFGYQFAYNETINDFLDFETFVDAEPLVEGGRINNLNNSHTVYTEYTHKTPKTYINVGLRNSLLSNTNRFLVEPRMFSSLEIFKNFRITTSAELKNQQLNRYFGFQSTNTDVSFLPVADNLWLTSGAFNTTTGADPFELPIFRSSQFTLGALYTYKGWNFDIEGYYKRLGNISSINNLILSIATRNDDDLAIVSGEENRIGIDFLIKKRIKNYRFWLGYSLSNTQVKFPDIQRAFYPGDFDQRHVFNVSQTLKIKNLELSLGWNYASGRPFTKIIKDTDDFLFGVRLEEKGINQNRFKDYHRLDASVLYRFNPSKGDRWRGTVGLSLRNIYDRKNIISEIFVGREDNDFNEFIERLPTESLQFTPDFVVRFSF